MNLYSPISFDYAQNKESKPSHLECQKCHAIGYSAKDEGGRCKIKVNGEVCGGEIVRVEEEQE